MATYRQLLEESIIELQNYLVRATPVTEQLADAFYRGATSQTWEELSQLFEGLEWVNQVLEKAADDQSQPSPFQNSMAYNRILQQLKSIFREMEAALINKDVVLIADLLKYEVVEKLKEIGQVVQITIDNEVVRHDLS